MAITKIKVLIVDDSLSVRNIMESHIMVDPHIEVIGKAKDPYEAASMIRENLPDVITLDIEMPKMDGLTFLKKIMSQHPIPVIIVSSLTTQGAQASIRALEYGAVEILPKPIKYGDTPEETSKYLIHKIKTAHMARVRAKASRKMKVNPKLSADAILRKSQYNISQTSTEKIIAIGASTGGTEAILKVLQPLDTQTLGIVIVQHMPIHFTAAFAKRLNETCSVFVKEAENGDIIRKGQVLIAPGNRHMLVDKSGGRNIVRIVDGPNVNRHKPSVDVLFRSVANKMGAKALGILLTGMGADGAQGLLEMKEANAQTIAQNESSSVVYGMPKAAVKLDAAMYSFNLIAITNFIKKYK